MNTLNQVLSVTSISIFLAFSLISGVSSRATTGSQFGLISVPNISNPTTNQPFVAPNRGTPHTTAGGGIRGFYLQSQSTLIETGLHGRFKN